MATLIVHPNNEEQLTAVKAVLQVLKITFEEESPFDPEFVAEILKAEEDIKNEKALVFQLKIYGSSFYKIDFSLKPYQSR